ncbi:MAG: hypothetical protein HZB13_00480 [Acidobacteria bacterium]|nr:hypothetical protein [Acidobacteriota bacterium]
MGKLEPADIDEYYEKHLPYRTAILLAHYRMTREPWTGDVGMLDACFVASLVTGRLSLNVLGVGMQRGKLCRVHGRRDDVDAEDLGGKFIDLATLPASDETLLVGFLEMANKAAAHFTLPTDHDWERTHEAIIRIHHYLRHSLYGHAGRRLTDAIP